MKRITSLLTLALLATTFIQGVPALAARSDQLTYVIPGDMDLYVEINPQEPNPVTSFLKTYIEKTRANNDIYQEAGLTIAETIANSDLAALTLKMENTETDAQMNGYFFIKVSPTQFTNFIEKMQAASATILESFAPTNDPATTDVTSSDPASSEIQISTISTPELIADNFNRQEEYKGITIYTIDGNAVTYYKNQYLVIADNIQQLEKLIDWSNNPTAPLSENSKFKSYSPEFKSTSFANIFINGTIATEFFTQMQALQGTSSLPSAFNKLYDSIGASFSYGNGKFDMNSKITLNPAAQKELNVYPDKYNFLPRFTKKFNHSGLIFFTEEFDIQQQLIDGLSFMPDAASIARMFEDELVNTFNITLDDIKKISNSNMAFALYDSPNSTIPSMTLITDVITSKNAAELIVKKLIAVIRTAGAGQVTESDMLLNGSRMATFTIENPVSNGSDQPTPLTLIIGISENNLIISTDNNLKDHYGNYGVTTNFNTSEEINSILYFNLGNANKLVTSIVGVTSSMAIEDVQKIADIIVAPFGALTLRTTANDNVVRFDGSFVIDFTKFLDYEKIAEIAANSAPIYDYMSMTPDVEPLCDVNALPAEEKTAIETLQYWGVIKGYPDNCYYPHRSVNRAEFITMVDRAFYFVDDNSNSTSFPDASRENWYGPSLYRSVNANIIKGYPDGNFHPADNVTLAEGLTVLYRVWGNGNDTEVQLPYTDIQKSDWYYPAVQWAYQRGILTESTKLNPSRAISRKEIAILIYQMFQ